MSYNGGSYKPPLKQGVDAQLQNAFGEGNWSAVARLAEKRAKTSNDSYYEVLKACAESQLEGTLERSAALVSIDELIRKGAVLKDVESLELYEWALRDLRGSFNYSETIGLMRARWVKANPRSPGVIQCLKACIQNWDLVNAQQIAANLDKSLATQRQFMFWNILLTHLLSTSEQCPTEKRKIYAMLAMKQLERAADLTESSSGQASDRSLRTEEEIIFYYRILASHSSPEEYLAHVRSPVLGALKQFDQGRKHLFLESLRKLENLKQWDAVFDFCLHALSKKEIDGSQSFFASDWFIWKMFILAGSKKPNRDLSLSVVQQQLCAFISAAELQSIPPMYSKNIGMALVELTFSLYGSSISVVSEPSASPRVAQMSLFLRNHGEEVSAFDDIKTYFEELTFGEARHLLEGVLMERVHGETQSRQIGALYVKLRYLIASGMQSISHLPTFTKAHELQAKTPHIHCKYCAEILSSTECSSCLNTIAKIALDLYAEFPDNQGNETSGMSVDPRVDLAIVASMCLLRLSGLRSRVAGLPPLQYMQLDLFLQALAILDVQSQRTPDNPSIRLLLTRLYLILGCASYAHQTWLPLGVKRTIHDSLSPIFFDRIASISPGLFAGPNRLMEPLRTYYTYTLKEPSPVKIWDAFESGSYSSVIEITEYCDKLRRSCTLLMTVVEERRAARSLGARPENLENIPFLGNITDDTILETMLDYGSIPDLEPSRSRTIFELISIGPAPSNTRSHLELLAEKYLQLCNFIQPKDYKPARSPEATAQENIYITETLTALHESLTSFLHLSDTPSKITGPELSSFTVLTLMSGLMTISLTSAYNNTPTNVADLSSAIKNTVAGMQEMAYKAPYSPGNKSICFHLSNMHATGLLRETAFHIKQGVSLIVIYHEREQAIDRTGKSDLHKDFLREIRSLDRLASDLLKQSVKHIQSLKAALDEPGWLDKITEWIVEREDDELTKRALRIIGGKGEVEKWAGKVLSSWREGLEGWDMVKAD